MLMVTDLHGEKFLIVENNIKKIIRCKVSECELGIENFFQSFNLKEDDYITVIHYMDGDYDYIKETLVEHILYRRTYGA